MLNSLHIENLAIIKCIDVDFGNGFTAMTGETGAGKSIIIDGINFLLGSKADKDLIRTGEASAMVSGVFSSLSEAAAVSLEENGIALDEDGSILIQRMLSQDGHSTVKINGRTVTLTVLRNISAYLVSIHGQRDTAAILDKKNQLELLDVYSLNGDSLRKYKEAYSRLENIRREIKDIKEKEKDRERLAEILRYQINDIDSVALREGEEDELIDRKLKIKNSEKIVKNAGFAFKALKGSEKGSASLLLDKSASALAQISDVIPVFSEYSETLKDILYQIDDIAENIYSQISDLDSDTEESLNEIESRLDKISKLKRKYGYTDKEVFAFRERAENELRNIENHDGVLKDLLEREEKAYTEALTLANALHNGRTEAARKIELEVKKTLDFLDMPNTVFFAEIRESVIGGKKQLTETGSDSVEFYISANKGSDALPISKAASGGELARIMLALKSVIADKDGITTVIFDEIDAGVSGKTARKIGIKMLSISKSTQLVSITHSAQIASLADKHLLIKKSEVDGATESAIRSLDTEGRIEELARILGGIDVTHSQRNAAVDMLNEKILI